MSLRSYVERVLVRARRRRARRVLDAVTGERGHDRVRPPASTWRGRARARPHRRRAGPARADLPRAGRAAQGRRRACCASTATSCTRCRPAPAPPSATRSSTSTAASACCSPTPARAGASCPNDTVLRRRRRSSRSAAAGTFLGQHIYTPRRGVAVQINAFNFPVWGPLEKFAPAFLAGVPTLVKPASADRVPDRPARRADRRVRPAAGGRAAAGLRQRRRPARPPHRAGPAGFTGSAATAQPAAHAPGRRRALGAVQRRGRLAELLDPRPGRRARHAGVRPVRRPARHRDDRQGRAEVHRDPPRVRAGRALLDAVGEAASRAAGARSSSATPPTRRCGWARSPSLEQREEVRRSLKALLVGRHRWCSATPSTSRSSAPTPSAARSCRPSLLRADDADRAELHEVEAFGPVSTLIGYRDTAARRSTLAARGQGSLAGSVVTDDADFARDVVLGIAPVARPAARARPRRRGGVDRPRLAAADAGARRPRSRRRRRGARRPARRCSTTCSAPPCRRARACWPRSPAAGCRAARARRRRPPVPQVAGRAAGRRHRRRPARASSRSRTSQHFAEFTGDTFYAHTDEEAAAANPFFGGRVAHGYLVAVVRGRAVRQPGLRPGAGQLRHRQPAVPHPGQARATS